jgi:hypothetical protein
MIFIGTPMTKVAQRFRPVSAGLGVNPSGISKARIAERLQSHFVDMNRWQEVVQGNTAAPQTMGAMIIAKMRVTQLSHY